MKQLLILVFMIFSASAHAVKYSTYKAIPSDAKGFAVEVVDYSPGTGASGVAAVQNNILGAPDDKYLSLGKKGSVTVRVGENALAADGTSAVELYVFEAAWWDSFDVYISPDNVTFTKLAITTQAKASAGGGSWLGFNLDGQVDASLSYPYVKIVDTSNSTSSIIGTDGADIDGVVITHTDLPVNNPIFYDTDTLNGNIFNLYKDASTGATGVKITRTNNTASYINYDQTDSLVPVALSVQSDFNGDSENDLEILVTRKSDNIQLNIVRSQSGELIKTITHSMGQ
ncbi:hypothetical protein [Pectobacterium brasiliense]|uniref:hypothetical protein n=1 Tax=Pectobacterium brasiliense TaxID=180957 RepID=UPI00057F10EE|nr:hypothetical protein [Pectobacterium brasiliense]KHT43332.1 hypothetical protein RD02_00855 [Pectobacterium brasiliense]